MTATGGRFEEEDGPISTGAGIGGGRTSKGQYITISGGKVIVKNGEIGNGERCQEKSVFSTGENGTAVIIAPNITDETYKTDPSTSGIIIIKNEGKVYGSPQFSQDITIDSGMALTIPTGVEFKIEEGKTFTNKGTIILGCQDTTDYSFIITEEGGKFEFKHNLEHKARKEATCKEDGNIEYWRCNKCNNYFGDAEGTNKIEDKESVRIPATGHIDNNNDGICDICGKRLREENNSNNSESQTGDDSFVDRDSSNNSSSETSGSSETYSVPLLMSVNNEVYKDTSVSLYDLIKDRISEGIDLENLKSEEDRVIEFNTTDDQQKNIKWSLKLSDLDKEYIKNYKEMIRLAAKEKIGILTTEETTKINELKAALNEFNFKLNFKETTLSSSSTLLSEIKSLLNQNGTKVIDFSGCGIFPGQMTVDVNISKEDINQNYIVYYVYKDEKTRKFAAKLIKERLESNKQGNVKFKFGRGCWFILVPKTTENRAEMEDLATKMKEAIKQYLIEKN